MADLVRLQPFFERLLTEMVAIYLEARAIERLIHSQPRLGALREFAQTLYTLDPMQLTPVLQQASLDRPDILTIEKASL